MSDKFKQNTPKQFKDLYFVEARLCRDNIDLVEIMNRSIRFRKINYIIRSIEYFAKLNLKKRDKVGLLLEKI